MQVIFWTECDFCIISDCRNSFINKRKDLWTSKNFLKPSKYTVFISRVPYEKTSYISYEKTSYISYEKTSYISMRKRHIFLMRKRHIFLMRKRHIFLATCSLLVLPIIRNQNKSRTIPHTVFEIFVNNNYWYKTQNVSWWVLWVRDFRNIHKSFFIKSHYWNLKLSIISL